jgi:hypothetical protein
MNYPRSTPFVLSVVLAALLPVVAVLARSQPAGIRFDATTRQLRIVSGALGLAVDCDRRCVLTSLAVGGREVLDSRRGGWSGIETGSGWSTTEALGGSPEVSIAERSARISGIRYGAGPGAAAEEWTFEITAGGVDWTITRTLSDSILVEDEGFPSLQLRSLDEYTGAILGTGGVAWFYLFNDSAMAYGVHTGRATFWKNGEARCLDLAANPAGRAPAVKFTRAGSGLSCVFSAPPQEARYRFDPGTFRRRFVRKTTSVWQSSVRPRGSTQQRISISAPAFEDEFGRGRLTGVDGDAVSAMLNTIARLGVIDAKLFGGNSWHTPYGPICLHEQYIGQFGIGIDDQRYLDSYKTCLDYYRDKAVLPDGRVKSRWAYTDEDASPGSADSLGFYEAQWGMLMDSNPDFAINVADAFDQCGDTLWLRSHKSTCERALDYMIRRDEDRDSLVEMETSSYRDGKGSDWLDVIWASWENALVNAEMYHALRRWSELEALLGDPGRARGYGEFADGLKRHFNRSIAAGGFWDEKHRWYVHWREKDGSVYGNNLVTAVNFMAIAYGLCDDQSRALSILRTVEREMQAEKLFFWPICMYPYEEQAGGGQNYPYPSYENGDIFLSWGELGVRAYAAAFPEIALRYINNLISRYKADGLAFQRYLRSSQAGAGDDILGGNAAAITGLYRDIYGIQPKYNRLYIEPHPVEELYGTDLRYRFRDMVYRVGLSPGSTSVEVGGWTFTSVRTFGIMGSSGGVRWFNGENSDPDLSASGRPAGGLRFSILEWGDACRWLADAGSRTGPLDLEVRTGYPGSTSVLLRGGKMLQVSTADARGYVHFGCDIPQGSGQVFEVRRVAMPSDVESGELFDAAPPEIVPGDTLAFSPAAVRVALRSPMSGGVIRYTLDGSDPDRASPAYAGPFSVGSSTVVSARVYRDGFGASGIARADIRIVPPGTRGEIVVGGRPVLLHEGYGAAVRLAHPSSPQYRGSGPGCLTDGVFGGARHDVNWQGFEGDDLDAVIDLGSSERVDSVRVGFLENPGLWIFSPLAVEMSGSTDGTTFHPMERAAQAVAFHEGGTARVEYSASGGGQKIRFIRIHAINRKVCPPGHPGAGGKAWLFSDEIVIE